MSDPTSPNRNYAQPTTGTDTDVWGDVLNANFGLIDNNFGGVSSISLSNVNVALSSGQYQCGTLIFSGAISANITITFPAVQAWWTVINNTTGAFYVKLTCGAGNAICSPPAQAVDIYADGTNMGYRNLLPVASYVDYAGSTVPSWITNCTVPPYLNCDGSTFSAVTYPRLNTIFGGTTLPDSKGRLRFNLNQGTSRIQSTWGIDGDTLFAAGGVDATALLLANVPAHQHTFSGSGSTGTFVESVNTSKRQFPSSPTNVDAVTDVSVSSGSHTVSISGVTGFSGSGTGFSILNPGYIGGLTLVRAG